MEAIVTLVVVVYMILGFLKAWEFFGGINYFTQPGAFVVALKVVLSILTGATLGALYGMVITLLVIVKWVLKFFELMFRF